LQRIARLSPLAEIWARVDALAAPVPPKAVDPAAAVGLTLAADVSAEAARPPRAIALRDGWAVASDLVLDAGSYSPVPLAAAPAWVEVGEALPSGTDAVLPLDAVMVKTGGAEALASVAPGEGVLAAGADATKDEVLLRAGERLRASDIAILRAAGVTKVQAREPRLNIFCVSKPTRSAADTVSPLLARAVEKEGARAALVQSDSLESALLDPACDAVLTVGGTGTGRSDAAVKTLARLGKVEMHGMAISPGETAALGLVKKRPVLMLPGRIDAALAVFLVIGRRLIKMLASQSDEEPGIPVALARKVASNLGLAEIVLVRRTDAGAEPLASGHFTWQALGRADGWIMVPSDSEGSAAGSLVEMRPLP
jgi:molybdopterin biosynthesis enzyme